MILSADRQPGQLLCVGFAGVTAPASLLARIGAGQVGGVILFSRNIESPAQLAELTNALRAAAPADLPLLVAIDQEGGRVQRLKGTAWPTAALLGAGAPERTRQVARAIGRELAAVGANLDFAPVLDVATEAKSTVIGDRAFSAEPRAVVAHGRAFLAGLRDAGVAGCGKHFPGHGGVVEDSHVELPRSTADRERLRAVDLVPFADLAGDLDAVMTAHVVYEAIDRERPATLSPEAVTILLRGGLAFGGVVFSDDLEMKAIADGWSPSDRVAGAVAAGCDVLLLCHREDLQEEAYSLLLGLQSEDPFLQRRIAESAARVAGFKRRRLAPFSPIDPSEAARIVGCEEHRRLAPPSPGS